MMSTVLRTDADLEASTFNRFVPSEEQLAMLRCQLYTVYYMKSAEFGMRVCTSRHYTTETIPSCEPEYQLWTFDNLACKAMASF